MKNTAASSEAWLGARYLYIGCGLLAALSVHCGGDSTDATGGTGGTGSASAGSIGDAGAASPIQGVSSSAGSAGDAPEAGSAGAPVSDPRSVVTGVVREFGSKLPLAGATVVIADQRTSTDANGRFTLPVSAPTYDVLVADADATSASVYLGLSRLDLVLVHRRTTDTLPPPGYAQVQGLISGGVEFPLSDPGDVVSVYVFSDLWSQHHLIGAGSPPYGPDYALGVHCATGATNALLFGMGTFESTPESERAPAAYSAASVAVQVSLGNGELLTRDLELKPTPTGTVQGVVHLPQGASLSNFYAYARFPYPNAAVTFPAVRTVRKNPFTDNGAFLLDLPSLEQAGGELCLYAAASSGPEILTHLCGLRLGKQGVSLVVQEPPTLSSPAPSSVLAKDGHFAWSAFEAGIAVLELEPEQPSPTVPAISVYTTQTDITLPDLSALGLTYPKNTTYQVRVGGLGPYTDTDDALGPEGIGSFTSSESRVSYSEFVQVTTAP